MTVSAIAPNDAALRRNLSRMLAEYAADCAASQLAEHMRRGRRRSTFRYSPPAFHQTAVETLGRGSSADVATFIHAPELARYVGVTARPARAETLNA